MTKKVVWILVSSLMVLSLVIASCAPKQEAKTETVGQATVVTAGGEEKAAATEEVVAKGPEVPQYGGTLTMMQGLDIQGFDHGMYPAGFLNNVYLVNDTLVVGDWSRGAAGTGEIDWAVSSQKRIDYTVGDLAETFEVPEPGTIVFHIRHGVHFSLDPNMEASRLVNGREMTADDVAFSLTRHIQSPLSYLRVTQPTAVKTTTAIATDKWTVTLKTSLYDLDAVWLIIGEREIWPPEVIQKYGNLTNWRNQVGNGAFMMTDYIPGSSATFSRNPNYWQKDPVGAGKGNQLPYLDSIRMLFISDLSTQLAALRTGGTDVMSGLSHDNWADMTRTAPQLQYHKYVIGPMAISMRQDKPDLPFKDKRVRQALMMAIDYKSIIQSYYSGDAEILAWPLANIKGYDKAYVPLDEMPDSVKELFTYNPDKAKQLLKDAGYPNGFKTKVIASTLFADADYLAMIRDMWSKVNVDLTIEPKEAGTYFNLTMSKQYDEMLDGFYVQPGPYAQLLPFRGDNTFNRSWVKDDRVEATYNEILKYNLVDQAKVDQLHRDLMPYVLEQAWYIPAPGAHSYSFWQPWLKNYHGEGLIGYQPAWVRFVWIDKELKQKTGR
jgi:peptide/nickel transport system substrate-binding protein